jgi:hypothetical protein
MRAMRAEKFSGYQELKLVDLPKPAVADGSGEIKLLRETFNPLAMAQAQLPHGVADIGPPGEEVHSF